MSTETEPPSQLIELYCISLWRPWAQWVMLGWKTIETRTHDRLSGLVGKRIAIHAALKWDDQATIAARDYLPPGGGVVTKEAPTGIIATAHVKAARKLFEEDSRQALIFCGRGVQGRLPVRHGLFLSDIRALPEPIPMKGQQGMWKVRIPIQNQNV